MNNSNINDTTLQNNTTAESTESDTDITSDANNLPTDYFKLFSKHYKKILSIVIAAILFLGVVCTFIAYIYNKSYYDYFNVSDNWIELGFTKELFNIIYHGCIMVIILIPNLISAYPFIFNKKDTKYIIKFELKFLAISSLIGSIVCYLFHHIINESLSSIICSVTIIWSLIFALPLLMYIMSNIIIIILVTISHPLKSIKYFLRHLKLHYIIPNREYLDISNPYRFIKSLLLFYINNLVSFMNKVDSKFYSDPESSSEEEKINNRNKDFFKLIIMCIIFISFIIISISTEGKNKATNEKNFSIIKLSDNEIETYDDLKQYKDDESPYIVSENIELKNLLLEHKININSLVQNLKKSKRIVNAKVILTENDEYFLIANSYIDYEVNDFKLYIFIDEQTIIEKNDILINKITLAEIPEIR